MKTINNSIGSKPVKDVPPDYDTVVKLDQSEDEDQTCILIENEEKTKCNGPRAIWAITTVAVICYNIWVFIHNSRL